MESIFEYISHPAGRQKIIRALGLFSVIGASIVSAILLIAIYLR